MVLPSPSACRQEGDPSFTIQRVGLPNYMVLVSDIGSMAIKKNAHLHDLEFFILFCSMFQAVSPRY